LEDVNFAIMQYWEISDVEFGNMSNGCSLHIDMISHAKYVGEIYKYRSSTVVDSEYNRIVGLPIVVTINDEIFSRLVDSRDLTLEEVEMNNLIEFEDLILT